MDDANIVLLVQIIIWPGLIVLTYFMYRVQINSTIDAIVGRIAKGGPVAFGPFSLGPMDVLTAEGEMGADIPQDIEKLMMDKKYPHWLSESIYLVHSAQEIVSRTSSNRGVFSVRVWLESYNYNKELNDCTRVTYRLFDDFAHKVYATEARNSNFEIKMNVYGEFNIVAYVERKSAPPLYVTRYIDLPGRPPD